MATKDGTSGSTPVVGKAAARRPRTAAEQRAEAETAKSPEALAKDIEQTREDLAVTLDAIADRVSPKRVARRSTKKAAASVRENALVAKEAVVSGAATAKEKVVAGAEAAKEKIVAGAEVAKEKVSGDLPTSDVGAGTAAVTPLVGLDPELAVETQPLDRPVVRATPPVATSPLGLGDAAPIAIDNLPSVTAVPVPELGAVRPGAATSAAPLRTGTPARPTPGLQSSPVKKEFVAAGAVALLLALLVRWRRHR